MVEVRKHNARLHKGFRNAIETEFASERALSENDIEVLAEMMMIFTNGLWSQSRTVTDAAPLRLAVTQFLKMIRRAGT